MNVAVITGASMGLGEEFARQLAARKQDMVLVARSEDKLMALSQELSERHRIRAVPFACDLAQPGAAEKVRVFLSAEGLHPTWLINNAGFGLIGPLDQMEPIRVREMMMLNMVTLVELTMALLPTLRLSQQGRIINVASTAAFQPIPYFNVYGSTKVFVLHFSEALREELGNTDVRVLCLCPGPTPTQFHVTAGLDEALFQKGQSAADVVRMGLEGSDDDRAVIVCQRAWANVAMRLLPRVVVRKGAAFVARQMMKRMGK
jgi:short-subunit dehydrogenase